MSEDRSDCKACKHDDLSTCEEPCKSCEVVRCYSHFEPKPKHEDLVEVKKLLHEILKKLPTE